MNSAGHPVAMASVYLVSSPVPMRDIAQLSGADGEFVLGALAPGTYVLGARSDDAGGGQATITIEGPEDQHLELTLAREG